MMPQDCRNRQELVRCSSIAFRRGTGCNLKLVDPLLFLGNVSNVSTQKFCGCLRKPGVEAGLKSTVAARREYAARRR